MNFTSIDKREIILIVDDSADNVAILNSMLKGLYRTKIALSGEKALEIAGMDAPPNLILLDVVMPGMDGYETCRRLKENPATAGIPVIFLTGRTDGVDEEAGLELGAVDFIAKPPSPSIVKARIHAQLQIKAIRTSINDQSAYLETEVNRRTAEISMVQDVAMVAMGSLAETRDNGSGNHILRTQNYIRILAQRLSENPSYAKRLTSEIIMQLYKASPLHDIGKIGIPDKILNKPARLDADEFELMKTHTVIGRDAILVAEKMMGSKSSLLACACEIAWSHHEKWDGTGYPRGLSGENIPLSGRLMAVSDVYDALISKRVYKTALSHEDAIDLIKQGLGTQFDPVVGKAFLNAAEEFREVSRVFSDRGLDGM